MGTSASRPKRHCQLCKKPAEVFCISHSHFKLLCAVCFPSHEREPWRDCYAVPIIQLEQFEQNRFEVSQGTLGPRKVWKGEQKAEDCEATNIKRTSLSLATIRQGRIYVWSLNDMQWSEATLSFPIMRAASFVWMDTTLFCSNCTYYAGELRSEKNNRQFACEIQGNGAVTRLPDMILPLDKRALWWYSALKHVLAFGGINHGCRGDCYCEGPITRECEMLSWCSTSWKALPALKLSSIVRCLCAFHQNIYIFSDYLLEIFDPQTCLFLEPLHISLLNSIMAVVDNNELVVVSDNYLTRFECADDGNLIQLSQVVHYPRLRVSNLFASFRSTQVRHYLHSKHLNQPPVVDSVNGILYFLCDQGDVKIFKMND